MPANVVAGPAPQAVDDASKIGAQEEPAAKAQPRQDTAEISTGIADYLDIPDDVLKQIAPKVVKEPKAEAKTPPAPEKAEKPEHEEQEEEEVKQPKQSPDTEEEPDEEEGEAETETEEEQPAAAEQQKPDKRQKRINRLTRKNAELEAQLDLVFNEYRTLKEKVEGKESAAVAAPGTVGLSHIANERQLTQEVAQAEAIIDWCDQNAEGVMIEEAGKEKFIESQEVAKWKRKAEKTVRIAPLRQKELEAYSQSQNYFDGLAKQAWPELFDKRSNEYQLAQSILAEFPPVKTSPQANWAVGLVIEGMKSLQGKTAPKGQAAANAAPKHRDIDERAFSPRVPLAPHTAEPPSREPTPSAHKRLKEATSALLADPDGSVGSLAKVFGALDLTARTSGGRQRVSV
jgi:hypothetical protein